VSRARPSVLVARTSAAEAPHAPVRGRLARFLGPLHVTGIVWYRLHAFGARRSEPFKRVSIRIVTALFHVALRHIRRGIAANLEVVLGPCGRLERERRLWRTFLSFAWSQTERYERLTTGLPFAVVAEERQHWERLTASGRGFLLVTGHVGNWEMASALPATEEGRDIHVVREEELDPRAQAWVAALLTGRLGTGYRTHFAHGDPLLGLALREALERGEIVALQGDRPRRGGGAVAVELFGRPFALPEGPLALARQTGVPILPAFVHREGRRRYRVAFSPPIEVEHTAERRVDLRRGARHLAAALEAAVRRTPHQWFVFRELWPELPEGRGEAGVGPPDPPAGAQGPSE
jgi:KDO2-lipid IV(A) lauroyltransferase